MARAMSIAGMVIAGLLVLVFGLDLLLKIPFGREDLMMDLGFVVSGAILGYLSWNAMSESK
jgi:hypothetical protein